MGCMAFTAARASITVEFEPEERLAAIFLRQFCEKSSQSRSPHQG
jgi:hypothetical protein